jgi:hypothetical protein
MVTTLDSGAVLKSSQYIDGAEYGRGIRRERGGPMCYVSVSKVGGGTRGKAYEGDWTVTLVRNGAVIFDQEILRTGTPKMHHEVAEMAVDYATADQD